MPEFQWSQTAASNTTADPNINWREGMAPSLVNDSARAMMAELAKKRDDDAGLLVTGGTSTAYALSTNQNLNSVTSPANVNGFKVSFQFHAANGAAATLSVDSQTAAPLLLDNGTAVPTGYFGIGECVDAVYKASIPAWIVRGGSLLSKTNTWSAGQTWTAASGFAVSGATPVASRRTENDTTLRKIFSGQSGSGAGDDYSINETGDGSNNVATVTEQIGSTVIDIKTKTTRKFPVPLDYTEVSTPAAPGSGLFRSYAKPGLCALYGIEGSGGSEHLIGPLALASARGLVIANNAGTPNTQVDITVSEAILTDSNGIGVYYSGGTLTANCAGTGANGLDTSTLAISTWYFLYLIYNPATNTFASLASLSATAPTMPSGYTAKMRVGAMITDGSAHFVKTRQLGNVAEYTTSYPLITNANSAAFTTFSLAGFVPTTAVRLRGQFSLSAAGTVGVRAASTAGTLVGTIVSGVVANYTEYFDMLLQAQSLQYQQTAAGGNNPLQAVGWVDAVNAI